MRKTSVSGELLLATESHLRKLCPVRQAKTASSTCPAPVAGECACPLSRVRAGTAVRIKRLLAAPELCRRLREMGITEEQQVRLLLQNRSVVCEVCNVRLGLSARLADSIWVEPLSDSQAA
jgi:Fe2+ transport system protein FeoA